MIASHASGRRARTRYPLTSHSGTLLLVRSQLTKVGNSSLGFLHEMRDTEQEILRATSEHVVALFSLAARKSTPLDPETRQRATELMNDAADAH